MQTLRSCFAPVISEWRQEYYNESLSYHDLSLLWKFLLIFRKTDKMIFNFPSWTYTVRTETHKLSGILLYSGSALTISRVHYLNTQRDTAYITVLPYFNFYRSQADKVSPLVTPNTYDLSQEIRIIY